MAKKLTENESKYIKFIYRKQVEEKGRLKTTEIASMFQVQPPSATEMLQKLAKKDVVKYESYRGVKLTDIGLLKAKSILRKHRLLETWLVNFLDYNINEACREAERLDYHASESLINKICQAYEHPEICPCNKPIFRNNECFKIRTV